MKTTPAAFAICVSLLGAMAAASAQTVLDTVTLYQEPSIRPPAADSLVSSETVSSIGSRHLPATRDALRLEGESATLEWPLVITDAEANSPSRFQLAYRSAASVLPEVSRLTLTINDRLIGRVPIAPPGEATPIEWPLERGILRAGVNTIRLIAEQRHRVDCSPEATYELWTDLDPARTGFVSDAPRQPLRLADLAALRHRPDGALAIRVPIEGPISLQRVDQIIRATQAVALIGDHQRVVVNLLKDDAAADGLTLMFDPAVSRLAIQQTNSDTAPTLVIGGATDADIDRSLAELIAMIAAQPRRNAMVIDGGETRSLLGDNHTSVAFSGHLARLPIRIDLPSDVLAADYGKITLDLAGTTADTFLAGTQLRVTLNGRAAASVALPSGRAFNHRGIAIPLSLVRPGANTLEIAANLAPASDPACGSSEPLDRAKPLLTLSGASRIHIPPLARIGRTPDLAQMAAGALPIAMPGARTKLYVPQPDRHAIAAAITLATQLAISARQMIAFDTVVGNPDASPGPALVVAPARALDPGLLQSIGVNADAIREAWQSRETDSAVGQPSVVVPSTVMAQSWSPTRLLEKLISDLREQVWQTATPAPGSLTTAAALIVAQGIPAKAADAMTIVTAPTSQMLSEGVMAWTAPAKWTQTRGGIAVLDASASLIEYFEATEVRFTTTQPMSFGNARLIVAGWLSIHPSLYALMALLSACVLGIATRSLVKNVGRRSAS
jgi:hypothetical protein